jgi:hypothetical protein
MAEAGDITDVPRISNRDLSSNGVSSRFITKADYLSLNNVRLGFSMPQDVLKSVNMTGFGFLCFWR